MNNKCLILILYCLKSLNEPNIFQSLIWRMLSRVKPILYHPLPMTLRQLRGFLGTTGYCHIWRLGYGEITQPLMRAWREGKGKLLSPVQLFATPWTVAHQAPPSVEFSRQEYWSGLPLPSPDDLPDPWIEPRSPALQADALPSEPPGKPMRVWIIPQWQTVFAHRYCHRS